MMRFIQAAALLTLLCCTSCSSTTTEKFSRPGGGVIVNEIEMGGGAAGYIIQRLRGFNHKGSNSIDIAMITHGDIKIIWEGRDVARVKISFSPPDQFYANPHDDPSLIWEWTGRWDTAKIIYEICITGPEPKCRPAQLPTPESPGY